jgi:hypothetical protein
LWSFDDNLNNDLGCEHVAAQNFELDLKNITDDDVAFGYARNYTFVVGLMVHLTDDNVREKYYSDQEYTHYIQRADKLRTVIRNYWSIFSLKICNKRTINDDDDSPYVGDPRFNKVRTWLGETDTKNEDEYTEKQVLLFNLFSRLSTFRLRKCGDYCYEQIYTDGHKPTHAWKAKYTIEEFIIQNCNRHKDPGNWKVLSKQKRNLEEMVFNLTTLDDHEFPRIQKDRHKFSFKNGIYISKVPVKDSKGRIQRYTDKFYPYHSTAPREVDSSMASANYFNLDFTEYSDLDDWYDIPTPNFQKVVDYQYPNRPDRKEIAKWMYIMLGRCLFAHEELDRWQVMMYIIGMPGTGKSTFSNSVLKKIYQETEIGILDNNIEEQFGLYNIIRSGDKFITIGVELDNTFKLKRTDFLKMVSGDDLMIAVKGKTGFTYLWKSHIICIGNKLFGFEDHKGELARRIVPFVYDVKVKTKDTDLNLDEKLYAELPNIIQKICKAYLWAAQKYGTKNVWCVLPKYFHEMKTKISEQTNALQAFMGSNEIEFGKDHYVLESAFRQRYMDFCKSRGLGRPRLTREMYKSVLQDVTEEAGHAVYYEPLANRTYPRKGGYMRKREGFIVGMDVITRDAFAFGNTNDKGM